MGDRMEDGTETAEPTGEATLEPVLRARLRAVRHDGAALWDRFEAEIQPGGFHPFVAADYRVVLETLVSLRAPGLRFLEWGSATGVITVMADLLGFDAYGIESDGALVEQARGLARRHDSAASFTAGSFLPTGYGFSDGEGDARMGTIADRASAYFELGLRLDDFDLVFGYPWDGEKPMMLDLMKAHGRPGARFLLHTRSGVEIYREGRRAA